MPSGFTFQKRTVGLLRDQPLASLVLFHILQRHTKQSAVVTAMSFKAACRKRGWNPYYCIYLYSELYTPPPGSWRLQLNIAGSISRPLMVDSVMGQDAA